MGTRFMATVESPIHQKVKEQIVANDERQTNLIFRTMHNTSRVLKNAVSDEVVKMEKAGATFEQVREHVRKVSKSLVIHKRLKVMHLWDADLPKTAARLRYSRSVGSSASSCASDQSLAL